MAIDLGDRRIRVTIAHVRAQIESLSAVVDALDADAVGPSEASSLWQSFDRLERLASAAKTLLARRVEQSGAWKRDGAKSAAAHLAYLGGTTTSEALRTIETSKRLAELPATVTALKHGVISMTQAAVVADAATAEPDAEEQLLSLASRTNVRELREAALRVKAAADPDAEATHQRIHANRFLRTYTDAEGGWNIVARGTSVDGARFIAALEPLVDQRFVAARKNGEHEAREAYAFDALMALGQQERVDEEASKSKRSRPRHLALLRADLTALTRGHVEGDEVCEIAGIGPVPVRSARQVLSDAILKLVITKGTDVANVVHLGRGPTAAQRIALLWSSPQCTNEACAGTFTQVDHRKPWAAKQETVLDNCDVLCTHCHWLKTHKGWALVEGHGRRAFVPPNDDRHPKNGPPP